MNLVNRLEEKARQLKSHIYALYRGIQDPRVPWYVKLLTLVILAYIISPIDIIPDFIPVLGLLDEVILVPLALALIMRLMPQEVLLEYQSEQTPIESRSLKVTGIIIVLLIWSGLTWLGYAWWQA